MSAKGRRLTIGLSILLVLIVIIAANWHLVYVAMESQPDCVAHIKPGTNHGGESGYSAAKSSC